MLALASAVTNLGDPRVWTLPEEAFVLLEPLEPRPTWWLRLAICQRTRPCEDGLKKGPATPVRRWRSPTSSAFIPLMPSAGEAWRGPPWGTRAALKTNGQRS